MSSSIGGLGIKLRENCDRLFFTLTLLHFSRGNEMLDFSLSFHPEKTCAIEGNKGASNTCCVDLDSNCSVIIDADEKFFLKNGLIGFPAESFAVSSLERRK